MEGRLHCANQFDPDRFRVVADDLETRDDWETFFIPRVVFDCPGIGGPLVIAEDPEGGARPSHEDSRGSLVAADSGEPAFGEIDNDGGGDPVVPPAQFQDTVAGVHGMLQGVSVVGRAIPHGAELFDPGHNPRFSPYPFLTRG
jgi:hypothetical protein